MSESGQTPPRRPPHRRAYAWPVLLSEQTHFDAADRGSLGLIADLRGAANSLPTAILDVSRFRASASGGGGREAAVSSGGTALGTHLVGAGPIARLLWGRRYSATEMGSETAIRAAILPSRARAIRVTSE